MNLNGFDRIAFIYDFLARLIFGSSIIASQEFFLDRIQDRSKVLILGGGSGWLLSDLLELRPVCEVWYIEASEKMITMARKKIRASYTVHFIHGTQDDIPASACFDVVITNFYLDLFTDKGLENVVDKIRNSADSKATWIVTDFVDGNKSWQKLMLLMMYGFFRKTAKIESERLPQWEAAVERSTSKKIDDKYFYGGFIKTACYQF
jgi:ubiquinone/menaquinone biosynthesis C-methylase UbiE